MATRGGSKSKRRHPGPTPNPNPDSGSGLFDEDDATWLGERLRRLALGLTAALIVARPYWPAEGIGEAESGTGLGWVFALIWTALLAVAAVAIAGNVRFRFSWADAGVYALIFLVGLSASQGLERRVAINLAWQWGGVGIAYFLLRNLPRGRAESATLAGALVATAVAVSVYAFYQVGVELPQLRQQYYENPVPFLLNAGVNPDPKSPEAQRFAFRLLYSTEPYSTFGLTNSLAGFLVGPIVLALAVGLENLRRRPEGNGSSKRPSGVVLPLTLAAIPFLAMLVCLVLTKSRSAYLGLAVGALVVSWYAWRGLRGQTFWVVGGVFLLILLVLVGGLFATGWLDAEVLTQSFLSLGYRFEYWEGTWRLLFQSQSQTPDGQVIDRAVWWNGLGPGNFRGPYLQHKLVESSEEIADPHNALLEVWSTAGLLAVLAFLAALGFGFWNLFGPTRASSPATEETAPSRRTGWLLLWAGLGGWIGVVLLGELNLFRSDDDLIRWLILGTGWALAVAFGVGLWKRCVLPPWGFGAAVLAIAVNLLAAGGIGYAPVALMLWGLLALGQNLRTDPPWGSWQLEGSRWWGVFPSVVLAALIGTFVGAITPYWRAEAALNEAAAVLDRSQTRPLSPDEIQRIQEALEQAIQADAYSVRPWLALAELEFTAWQFRRAPVEDPVWERIESTLAQGRKPPRNPYSLEIQRRRVQYARRLLQHPDLTPAARQRIESILIDALGKIAVRLHPTSAQDRAALAFALGNRGYYQGAASQGEIAIALDAQVPDQHIDKKLPDAVRDRLQSSIPRWDADKPAEED